MLPLESSPRPQFRPRLPRSVAATIPSSSTSVDAKEFLAWPEVPEANLPACNQSRSKSADTVPLTDSAVFHRNALDA